MYRFLLLASTALASGAVNAATVTLDVNHGVVSSSSPSIAGAFDLSGLLAPLDTGNSSVEVNSAQLSIFGYSPYQNNYTNNTTSTYYRSVANYVPGYSYQHSCSFWSGCSYTYVPGYTTYYYVPGTHYRNESGDRVTDTARVDFGAGVQTVSGGVSGQSTYYNYYSGYSSRTTTVRYNQYGSLSTTQALNTAAIGELSDDWVLDYYLSAVAGQFSSVQLRLSVDYTVNTVVDNNEPEPVPLPATLPLMLAGVGGLTALARRRRRA